MACAHPLHIQPQYLLGSHYITSPHIYDVPCGYCVCCRRDKQNYLCDRAEYEYCKRLTASFVTITYDDIHLVDRCAVHDYDGSLIFDDDNHMRATLNYDDVRRFIHKIREFIKYHKEIQNVLCQEDFSYMYCMEYGDCFQRPHAHILFFGLDFAYCKKLIFEQWKYGFIDVLPLLDGGIRYVTKYMDKMEKGELAWLKYDCKGMKRPKLCTSIGFGQGLLWDNAGDIVDNFYTYKVKHNKRRPISAYWKSLLTGNSVSRDVTKDSFFEQNKVYKQLKIISRADSMRERNLHRRVNIYSEYEQRKYRLQQALNREKQIITQLHNEHIPVYDDFSEVVKNKYGFPTYDGSKVRKLPTLSQRLLSEEYRYTLEKEWLEDKFA